MNVDPVVRENVGAAHNEHDGEIIAVAQLIRGAPHLVGRGRIERVDQVTNRHAGDEVLNGELDQLTGVCPRLDVFDTAARATDAFNADAAHDLAARPFDEG